MDGWQWVHAAATTVTHLQTTCSAWTDIMVVSQVIFSGITLGPWVNQLATSKLALAHSLMSMQLCRHYREVKNLQQSA